MSMSPFRAEILDREIKRKFEIIGEREPPMFLQNSTTEYLEINESLSER